MMTLASAAPHAFCAAVGAAVAFLSWYRGRPGLTARLLGACAAATAIWAAAIAWNPVVSPLEDASGVLELVRMGLWIALLLHLQGREATGTRRARRMTWAAAAILGGVAMLPELSASVLSVPATPALLFAGLTVRLGLAMLVIVLAENVHRNAVEATRWHVTLPCIALGGLAAFDMAVLADAMLARAFSPTLLDARAILAALAAPLLLVAALRDRRWSRRVQVPREAVFHGVALLLGGAFLAGLGAAGEAARQAGGDWGKVAEVSLLAGGAMTLAVALASRSLRSRLKRRLVDPFFRARFDYRQEWMRCITALSAPDSETSAHVRAIRAVADAVDSPGGVLLLREPEEARFSWAGSWNAPATGAPEAWPLAHALSADRVLVFSPADPAPAPLTAAYGSVWLAVPVPHHREGVIGAVLLAPPRAAFPLDDEVFTLLRALGREVALLLAERRAAERLADGRRITDYAARFAFVAHDVKTVSGGLKLLLGNAEAHMSDPDFQRDMLVTVRAATARIDGLIARLREPTEPRAADDRAGVAPTAAQPRRTANVRERLHRLAAARHATIEVDGDVPGALALSPDTLDAAVGHLLDNAVETSPPGVLVRLRLHRAGGRAVLDITDRGCGMTESFIRDELFRPFRTGRPDGNGIGAWQARELLREAGGALEVLSHPGVGTTMRLIIPMLADAALVPQETTI